MPHQQLLERKIYVKYVLKVGEGIGRRLLINWRIVVIARRL